MFNAPRVNRGSSSLYQPQTSSLGAFGGGGQTSPNLASTWNPLSFEPDPWSSAPTAASSFATPPPVSSAFSSDGGGNASGAVAATNLVDEDALPGIYLLALEAADPVARGEAGVGVTALGRVVRTSGLPAGDVERIVNAVSGNAAKVTRHEFFLSLVLVGLVQEGSSDISRDAALSRHSDPPTPALNLDSLHSSRSTIRPPASSFTSSSTVAQHVPSAPPSVPSAMTDPWTTSPTLPTAPLGQTARTSHSAAMQHARGRSFDKGGNGSHPLAQGLLAIPQWWNKEPRAFVRLVPQKEGRWPGLKWTVYEVVVKSVASQQDGPGVHRRYSEFAWLADCLVKRYPFRCIVGLPPKRLGADPSFLEQRRRALARFLQHVVGHPVLRADHLVQAFLTEPNLEVWRKSKGSKVNLDEERKGGKLSQREELEVPMDLHEKLAIARRILGQRIASWSSLTQIFERNARRLEALSADASRFANALSSLAEAEESWKAPTRSTRVGGNGWTGPDEEDSVLERDELGEGVRKGLGQAGASWEQLAVDAEGRSQQMIIGTLEAFKAHRDLLIGFRETFARFDRLSPDPVEKLEKKMTTTQSKVESVRKVKKPGYEAEVDKLVGTIEADQTAIEGWLARRGVIQAILWHELSGVVYPREHTLVTLAFQRFAKEEAIYAGGVLDIWRGLEEALEDMPLE